MHDLPITVPEALHDAMAEAMGEAFAVSYLCGANLQGDVLHTRTETALRKLRSEPRARAVLIGLKIVLGTSIRPEHRAPIPGVYSDVPPPRRRS